MSNEFQGEFTIDVETSSDEEFTRALIRDRHEVFADEPDWGPSGGLDEYASPVDYMLSALVFCQVAVLQHCLKKSNIETYQISADGRIDQTRIETVAAEMPGVTGNRIDHIDINIELVVPPEFEGRANRCLDVYDSGCIVGQSYKAGVNYTPQTTLTVSTEEEE